MAWRIELTETAAKSLAKLDRQVARRITKFLGETLAGPNALWRYRVGEFRIVVSIEDTAVRVLVIRIGHRREIYR